MSDKTEKRLAQEHGPPALRSLMAELNQTREFLSFNGIRIEREVVNAEWGVTVYVDGWIFGIQLCDDDTGANTYLVKR